MSILLLEDDPADEYLVRMAMKQASPDTRISTAVDGREGLALLRREDGFDKVFDMLSGPDLILLDINMPGMDGHTFLAELKQDPLLCALPVVILTTSSDQRDISQAYVSGAAGYIVKPLSIEALIEALRCLCDYWGSVTELPKKMTSE
ncbi:response regulator [Vreelandella rituensis]|uniref:response regulator n=1 Tax=Vreelandella rituensis TaxID=2282306 RepID=UPI0015EFF470|nr:response regulator [Halomonas rituensis]